MPKGPTGQKRPADSIGCAVTVARIATGEQEDTTYVTPNRRKSGLAGSKARMESVDAERRSQIATKAARAKRSGIMMTDKAALDRIYDGELKVKNLKLFPGTHRDASPEDVLDQVDRVISEIENDVLEVVDLDD